MKKKSKNIYIFLTIGLACSFTCAAITHAEQQTEAQQKAPEIIQKLVANPEMLLKVLHPREYEQLQRTEEATQEHKEQEEEKTQEIVSLLKGIGRAALGQFHKHKEKIQD